MPRIALTKAIADLRRGQPEVALEILEVANNGFRKQKMSLPPMLHLYTAIAHAKLGHQRQAESALNLVPSVEQDDFRDFTDFIITHTVRQEAEELIEQIQSKADTE